MLDVGCGEDSVFFFEGACDHRDLHVLTHSFPTRRSSDLKLRSRRRQQGGAVVGLLDEQGGEDSQCSLRLPACCVGLTGRLRLRGLFNLRSEEHTSELQSLMRISYAVFCLKKKNIIPSKTHTNTTFQ